MGRTIKKLLVRILVVPLAALFFVVEEYLWVHLESLAAWFARIRVIARLEARIAALGPYPAMALFLVPMSLAWGVKLFGLYLLSVGSYTTAVAVLAAGKIVGTAFAARLFHIAKPALLTLRWFARAYGLVMRAKRWALVRLHASPAYRAVKRSMQRMRTAFAAARARLREAVARAGRGGALARYLRAARARWRKRAS